VFAFDNCVNINIIFDTCRVTHEHMYPVLHVFMQHVTHVYPCSKTGQTSVLRDMCCMDTCYTCWYNTRCDTCFTWHVSTRVTGTHVALKRFI